jgi:hypothetical protein
MNALLCRSVSVERDGAVALDVGESAPPEKTLLSQISSHQCLCPDRVRVAEFDLLRLVVDAHGVAVDTVRSINRFVSSLLDGLFDP